MADKQLEDIFSKAKPIEEGTETVADLAGYQVTKAELFSHTREPAITIWPARIRFNMACLRRFPGITHIQILIHPGQKRLIIRPCLPDAPDSLRWAKGSETRPFCTSLARVQFGTSLLHMQPLPVTVSQGVNGIGAAYCSLQRPWA